MWKKPDMQQRFLSFLLTLSFSHSFSNAGGGAVEGLLCCAFGPQGWSHSIRSQTGDRQSAKRWTAPCPSPSAWAMAPTVADRHTWVYTHTGGKWTLWSLPSSFCLTFSCSSSSVPYFRWGSVWAPPALCFMLSAIRLSHFRWMDVFYLAAATQPELPPHAGSDTVAQRQGQYGAGCLSLWPLDTAGARALAPQRDQGATQAPTWMGSQSLSTLLWLLSSLGNACTARGGNALP